MLLYYERFVVSQHNWRRKPKIHFKRYWSCRAFASPLYCTVPVSTWNGGANGHFISFCGVYNAYIWTFILMSIAMLRLPGQPCLTLLPCLT